MKLLLLLSVVLFTSCASRQKLDTNGQIIPSNIKKRLNVLGV